MHAYRRRTGVRITYLDLAKETGIAHSTLRAMGSKLHYNATLDTLEKLCLVLDVTPGDMLELIKDPPKVGPSKPKKRAKKPR